MLLAIVNIVSFFSEKNKIMRCCVKKHWCSAVSIGFFLMLSNLSIGQNREEATLLFTLEQPMKQIYVDALQQIYVVSEDNRLTKYDSTGQQLFMFSNALLGNIQKVDVSNPMNVLVFYYDYQTIVLLDRTLAKPKELVLWDLDLVDIESVALSSDNQIWLYDKNNFRLLKINSEGKILFESANLSLLIVSSLRAKHLQEHATKVWLNDPELGIFVFDLFGKFLQKIDIRGIDDLQLIGNQLIFREKEVLKAFNWQSKLEKTILELPKNNELQQVLVLPNRQYYHYKNRLEVKAW